MNITKTLLAPALIASSLIFAEKPQKPNIVFILADDLQIQAIHALGAEQVVSPNIDQLVREGTTFTNTYVNGSLSGAVCMASRAMLMTGRGIFEIQGDGSKIAKNHVTMPEYFKNNGYTTFETGKWHSDFESYTRSFTCADNIFFGGMHPYELNGQVSPRLRHFDPTGNYGKTVPFIGNKFSSEMFADAAIQFLDSIKKDPKPFFAYVAFTSPHDPRNQHPDYGYTYKWEDVQLPPNAAPQSLFNTGDLGVRDEKIIPIPRTDEVIKRELAFYYGMVSEMDYQLGRIIHKLKETGTWDNTIIVFASDNGIAVGQHGLMGKQNLYNCSSNVPLIIVGNGVAKNVQTAAYCYLSDIFPTLCDMTNLPQPSSISAHSLLPVLQNKKPARDHLFLAYSNIQRSFIKDGWKYVIYNASGTVTEQLFNIANDPWELKDYSKDPAYAQKKKNYKTLLSAEMKSNNDFCSFESGNKWWGRDHIMTWEELINQYTFDR